MTETAFSRYSLLYCTTPNQAEAERIGQILLEEQLVACVNILPGMISIYRWESKIEQANEVILLMKTTTANSEKVAQRVVALHHYDCPAVFSLPIESGHPEFLAWIQSQVGTDH